MLLGPDDLLPHRPRRVLVSGSSGVGKSTLARALGVRLGLPYTELDGLYHGPGWVPRPEFVADVRALVAGEEWVTEWQYTEVRPLLLDRCDLVVHLDVPRRTAMWRVTRRTLSRRLRRTELWNGNREGPLWHLFHDPEHIVRWAWSSYPVASERIAAVLAERPQLPVVRLRAGEVEAWRDGPISRDPGTPGPPR
ncbi:MAG: AAA family ATPase [Marmoricola sp.]